MADTDDQKPFRIILPEGEISYKRKSDMLKRLVREKEAWGFLEEIDWNSLSGNLQPIVAFLSLSSVFATFDTLIQHWKNATPDDAYEHVIGDDRTTFWNVLPFSNTSEGAAAIRAGQSGDPDTAVSILSGVLMSRPGQGPHLQQLTNNRQNFIPVAQSVAAAAASKIADQIMLKESVKKSVTSAKSDIDALVDESGSLANEIRSELEAKRNDLQETRDVLAKNYEHKSKLFKWLVRRGIEQNQQLQDRFLVQMRYRAPVQLWETRRSEHETKASNALLAFFVIAGVFACSIVCGVVFFGDNFAQAFQSPNCLPEKPETCVGFSLKGPLVLVASTLVTSLVLWILRHQMKVHLSERHLALDAEEKKAFAETFLALKEDQSVGAEQEAIVLQSLFRPTQDGIIRDDTPLDISPAGLVSRLLSRNIQN